VELVHRAGQRAVDPAELLPDLPSGPGALVVTGLAELGGQVFLYLGDPLLLAPQAEAGLGPPREVVGGQGDRLG
jgi:hypothetical protein